MNGVKGTLLAGIWSILPGVRPIMALSWIYIVLGNVTVFEGLFFGLKAAVLAIVVRAVIRSAGKALKGPKLHVIALATFLALFLPDTSSPVVTALTHAIAPACPRY